MLYTFHRVLIVTASVGALAFVAWCAWSFEHGGGAEAAVEGLVALLIPVAAAFYLRALKRKVAKVKT